MGELEILIDGLAEDDGNDEDVEGEETETENTGGARPAVSSMSHHHLSCAWKTDGYLQ